MNNKDYKQLKAVNSRLRQLDLLHEEIPNPISLFDVSLDLINVGIPLVLETETGCSAHTG